MSERGNQSDRLPDDREDDFRSAEPELRIVGIHSTDHSDDGANVKRGAQSHKSSDPQRIIPAAGQRSAIEPRPQG